MGRVGGMEWMEQMKWDVWSGVDGGHGMDGAREWSG